MTGAQGKARNETNKLHEDEIVEEGKSDYNTQMGNLELAFVKNKKSFWTQWKETPHKKKK